MDPQRGVCIGCYRTLDEIGRWTGMTDAERERIIAALPERKANTGHGASTSITTTR
jgi:predicted Fe-S protein YdhL (DUF1289 family)